MILKKLLLLVPVVYLIFLGGCGGDTPGKTQAQTLAVNKLAVNKLSHVNGKYITTTEYIPTTTGTSQLLNEAAGGNLTITPPAGVNFKDYAAYVAYVAKIANSSQNITPATPPILLEVRSADLQTKYNSTITLTGSVKHLITLNNGAVYLVYDASPNQIDWWDNSGVAQNAFPANTANGNIKKLIGATNTINSRIAAIFDDVPNVVQIFDETGTSQADNILGANAVDITILDDSTNGIGFLVVENNFKFETVFDATVTFLYVFSPSQTNLFPRTDQNFWTYNDTILNQFFTGNTSLNTPNYTQTLTSDLMLADANRFNFALVSTNVNDTIDLYQTSGGMTGSINFGQSIEPSVGFSVSALGVFRNNSMLDTDYDDIYAVTSDDLKTLNAYLWNNGSTDFDISAHTFSGNISKFARNLANASASSTKVAIVY